MPFFCLLFALNYKPVEFWLSLSHLVNTCIMCWTWQHTAIVLAIREPEAGQFQEWGRVYLPLHISGGYLIIIRSIFKNHNKDKANAFCSYNPRKYIKLKIFHSGDSWIKVLFTHKYTSGLSNYTFSWILELCTNTYATKFSLWRVEYTMYRYPHITWA